MAEEWSFPESLVNSIAFHHSVEMEGNDGEKVELIEPAIRLVSILEDECSDDNTARMLEVAVKEFSMDQDEVTEMIETAFEEAGEFSQSMS